MKLLTIAMTVGIIFVTSCSGFARERTPEFLSARRRGGDARIVLKAVDDVGNPVAGASIHVLMGMNYRLKSYDIDGLTDTNGVFVVEGKTTGNEIEITAKKDGYYRPSKKRLCFIAMGNEYEVKDGKWQPWGMEIPLVFREVRNPVKLISKVDGYMIPATNCWIGFDMELMDWNHEGHGGKVTDFEVNLDWDGKPIDETDRMVLNVRFPGKHSGFYVANRIKGCTFGGVYHADTNRRYENRCLSTSTKMRKGDYQYTGYDPDVIMVVRTRCKEDSRGNLVAMNYSTLYGIVVDGGWRGECEMRVKYKFNPTPNDTNLEPKR